MFLNAAADKLKREQDKRKADLAKRQAAERRAKMTADANRREREDLARRERQEEAQRRAEERAELERVLTNNEGVRWERTFVGRRSDAAMVKGIRARCDDKVVLPPSAWRELTNAGAANVGSANGVFFEITVVNAAGETRRTHAGALGFDGPTRNSLDSVSARDFALEYLAAASILATHLSRMAEEMVVWSSAAFGFISFSDAWSTGSSIMPQKRNPDAAELLRAKVGRIFGAFTSLLLTMKGLPLAYSKDMQEDKEVTFLAADAIELSLAAAVGLVADFQPDRGAMRAACLKGHLTATDLADWLVRALGLPFREAHHVTGTLVALADEKGARLDELTLEDLQSVHASITADVFDVLSVEASVASRQSFGGTAPDRVREAIAAARSQL